jgi:HrpA-like RNA helicase
MAVREYIRLCKQAGCGQEFIASASSLDQDRSIGFSEPEYCPKHRALHARSYSRIACHHYDVELTPTGEELIRAIEQHKIAEGLKTEDLRGKVFNPWAMPAEGLGPGGLGCFQRPLRAFVENSNYQPQKIAFQIADKGEEIWKALEDHQVVVLVGTTGSGKSTYVPWLLLTGGEPGQLSKWARRGPICVTQPRIQATRQVPAFIAKALNGTSLGIGSQIGFSHAKADEYDRRTRLIFKTDGKLINDIVSGAVANYSIVVIDEAHERSVNIDLILGLLKDQLYLYPHLRVIIASATIDHESFIGFFGGESRVPYIYSEGRRFTITEHWWGDPEDDWWKSVNQGQQPTRDQHPYAIAELTRNLCNHLDSLPSSGNDQSLSHILAFLPGTREIDQTVSLINAYGMPNVVALPLYTRRPQDEQDAALNPDPKRHPTIYGKRRVVVSTNVAETSLTVEGVRYVIDTGYIKQAYWNPITEVSELQTVRHSQAGCRQRWGRAGRISAGHAYKLYTKAQFEDGFPIDSTPDIARSSLEEVLLSAKAAGVRTIKGKSGLELDFDWMPLSQSSDQKRFRKELTRAFVSLSRQGALNEDGDLTRFGLELRGMPAAINVTRVFTEGERHGMGIEVATLLPFLKLAYGIQMILLWKRDWDSYAKLAIRQRHLDFFYGCQDDLDLYFKLWTLWEERTQKQRQDWEEEAGISFKGFQENIEEERRRLIESTKDWRKAEKRQVAIEKLEALRALIAHCLREEIYLPIEESQDQQSMESGDSRLRMPDILPWESYWEGVEQETEDEELVFDPNGAMKVSSRSGVYRRLGKSSRDSDESSLLEISPTSICFGMDSGDPLLACQRRANFRRPARAKVMGMNMIRIKRDWMKAIEGSLVRRTLLYSSLARRGDRTKQQEIRKLLFLPWLIPRGMKVSGEVCESKPNQGTLLNLQIILPTKAVARGLGTRLSIQGWLRTESTDEPLPEQGQKITAETTGYSVDEFGEPLLLLGQSSSTKPNYHAFAKRHRNGTSVEVEMRQVLEDPLGRSPMFIVRDCAFGFDIPMADSDFCGNTHPQSYFGRRFEIGERFEVDVEKTYADSESIYLTRARHLLQEYAGIPYQDQSCIEVTVSRVVPLGVFLFVPPSGYVGFVRRPLWPDGFDPKPGDKVRARLRRFDRHVNVKQMMEYLKEGQPLPEELDLGVELDLRIPPAYDRFCEKHQVGDQISVTAEKALDSGELLVTLSRDLKSKIYESELELDSQGRLKRARDYQPGDIVTARIYQMLYPMAMVRCSLFRLIPIPESLQIGQTLEVEILTIREDRQEPDQLWLTCSLDRRHQVQVKASAQELDSPLAAGDIIRTTVQKLDRMTSLIRGSLVERVF